MFSSVGNWIFFASNLLCRRLQTVSFDTWQTGSNLHPRASEALLHYAITTKRARGFRKSR